VYDVISGKDTFAKTTREIAEYVGREFEDAGEFRTGMVEMELTPLVEPTAPTSSDAVSFELWKMERRAYEKRKEARRRNSYRVYALVLGQCSQAIRNRMEASEQWASINDASDVMELLKLIQNCMIQRQTRQKPIHSLLDAEAQVYGFRQRTLPNNEYYEKFKDLVTNAERLGSNIGAHPERVTTILASIAADPTAPTTVERDQAKEVAKDQFLAVMFLLNCDRNRYGTLIRDIENEYTRGTDTYPSSLSAAYDYIVNYRPDTRTTQPNPDESGLSYHTEDGNNPGRGRGRAGRGRGRGSGSRGRGSRDGHTGGVDGTGSAGSTGDPCTFQGQNHAQADGDEDEDAQFLLDNLEQVNDYSGVYSNFIGYTRDYNGASLLLDSCSTVNLIANKHLLHGIHKAPTTMRIKCTAGVASTNLQGWLGDFPEPVWYIPQGVANILSFFIVQRYYRIQCDTHKSNTLLVTKSDGTGLTFSPIGNGLYGLTDPSHGMEFFGVSPKRNQLTQHAYVNTVEDRKREYTKREYRDAVLARRIQNIIMFPGVRAYTKIADSQLIANLPIGRGDIAAAERIFGPTWAPSKAKRRNTGVCQLLGGLMVYPRASSNVFRKLFLPSTLCLSTNCLF
jgi:hypothetical protein